MKVLFQKWNDKHCTLQHITSPNLQHNCSLLLEGLSTVLFFLGAIWTNILLLTGHMFRNRNENQKTFSDTNNIINDFILFLQSFHRCRSRLDNTLSCGINHMSSCLSGPCPTILDVIPVDLRPIYGVGSYNNIMFCLSFSWSSVYSNSFFWY